MKSSLIIGLVAGFAVIIFVIFLNENVAIFINYSGILITLGGTLCAILVYFSYTDIRHSVQGFFQILTDRNYSAEQTIDLLVQLNSEARVNGFNNLSLDSYSNYPFMVKGMKLVADNTDSVFIREILLRENRGISRKHNIAENVFYIAGSLSPMFGMMGTVIGLIAMLNKIQNPEEIPAAMGLALVTTLYGLILSALVFKPISGKIRVHNLRNTRLRLLVLEGILSIQNGENNQILKERLHGFLD
jgi:chemotaxis protein MotA